MRHLRAGLPLVALAFAACADGPVSTPARAPGSALLGVQESTPSWGLDRIDQRALPLNGRYLYDNDGSGVRIFVVGHGIQANHPELEGRVAAGYDYYNENPQPEFCTSIGTRHASVAAGKTYGAAKKATLVPVRVVGCNNTYSAAGIAAGIRWAADQHFTGQPDVILVAFDFTQNSTVDDAVTYALGRGVTVVARAGETGPQDACVRSPGRVAGAVTVSATDNTDARWASANHGSCVDLFAPGVNLPSVTSFLNDPVTNDSGTGYAAALVAGAAAIYLKSNPSAAPSTVHAFLVNNATTGVVTNAGTGSPNRLLHALAPAPLGVSLAGNKSVLACGESWTYVPTITGGTAPYQYTWRVNRIYFVGTGPTYTLGGSTVHGQTLLTLHLRDAASGAATDSLLITRC